MQISEIENIFNKNRIRRLHAVVEFRVSKQKQLSKVSKKFRKMKSFFGLFVIAAILLSAIQFIGATPEPINKHRLNEPRVVKDPQ